MGLSLLALPWLAAHPEKVEQLLSRALQTDVKVQRVQSDISARPRLLIEGLALGQGSVRIERAAIELDPYGFLPTRQWIRNFAIVGTTIDVEQTAAGWRVRAFNLAQAQQPDWLAQLQQLKHIRQFSAVRSTLRLAPMDRAPIELNDVSIALRRQADVVRVAMRLPSISEPDSDTHLLVMHWNPKLATLQSYLQLNPESLRALSQAFALPDLDGLGEGRLWLNLAQGRIENGRIELRAQDHKGTPTIATVLDSANGREWFGKLSLRDDEIDLSANIDQRNRRVELALSALDLSTLAKALGAHAPRALAKRIAESKLVGSLVDFRLKFAPEHAPIVRGRLLGFGIAAVDKLPGVKNADVLLYGDVTAIAAELQSTNFSFDFPRKLRKSIGVANIRANLDFHRAADAWSLDVNQVHIQDQQFAANGFFTIDKNVVDPAPNMMLSLDIPRGKVVAAGLFFPYDKMPKRALEWLDTALRAGSVQKGRLLWRGPFKGGEFPYHRHQGRMEAQFALDRVDLKFSELWPNAIIDAERVTFINERFTTDSARGLIVGNKLPKISADIAQFSQPILSLKIDGNGDGQALLDLLRQSPIGTRYGDQFVHLQMAGPAQVTMQGQFPLKAELGEKQLHGEVKLDNVGLNNDDWHLVLDGLKGNVRFNQDGFAAESLSALQAGLPVQFSMRVGESMTKVRDRVLAARLSGQMTAATIFGHEKALQSIIAETDGVSDWSIDFRTERRTSESQVRWLSTVDVASDLYGTAINLPVPLGKLREQSRSLRLSAPIEENSERLIALDVGNQLRLLMKNQTPFAGVLLLGNAQSAPLPESGLAIYGRLDKLEPEEWSEMIKGALFGDAGVFSIASVDIAARELAGLGGAVKLLANRTSDGWQIDLDSRIAEGRLVYNMNAPTPSMLVQLNKLHLPEPDQGGNVESNLDPRLLPVLHVYIKDFHVGQAKLGATRLETYPVANGLRVDLLESKSPTLALTGRGDWTNNGTEQSDFKLRFSSEDLGNMLEALGFAGHVESGQTLAEIEAKWQGAPVEFALAKLDGHLKVWVGPGRFLELNPGAGRLFGLLSVRELPRRIALDFRDFFQSGMSFNEVKGDFKFVAGNAFTENLSINAPSADIRVVGRTGLSTRDYEQTAMVNPKVGVLPVVGAVAAGPVGAAAGVLAQGVLGSDKMVTTRYQITGTWEKPMVTKLRSDRSGSRTARSNPDKPTQ